MSRKGELLQKAFIKAHKACYGCGPDGWTEQYKRDVRVFQQGVRAAQHPCGPKFFMAGFNAQTKDMMAPKSPAPACPDCNAGEGRNGKL